MVSGAVILGAVYMFGNVQEASTSDLIFDQPKPKKSKLRKFNIHPVLREEVCVETVPLEEFYVLTVKTPKLIGKILNALPPLSNDYTHLKRIKDGRILIQPSSLQLANNFIEVLSEEQQLLPTDLSISSVLVPKIKPITKKQFQWAKKFWPTSFHPDKTLESLLDGTFMDVQEQEKIASFLLRAEKVGNGGRGCVIVDKAGCIVAESGEEPTVLGHPVMCAVSALCKSHCAQGSDVVQYLGTGFDVFLTDEPCAMCAMALVHFRVGRVFFCKKHPKDGALESVWRIQEERSLNHHYSVFRIDEVSD